MYQLFFLAASVAISYVGTYQSNRSASRQAANQQAWTRYNSQMQYNVNLENIFARSALAEYNAKLAMQAGRVQSEALLGTAAYNSQIIQQAVDYNDELAEQELTLMWESADLDLTLLERQRAIERGAIVAQQGASGTIIGEGSNATVIIDQKTQEEMDAFVIKHGADIQASKIQNARAQSRWQGEVEVQKTLWEGQMGSWVALSNASLQAAGIRAESRVSAASDYLSARYGLRSGDAQAVQIGNYTAAVNQQNMISGLYSSASMVVEGVGRYSTPSTTQPRTRLTGTRLSTSQVPTRSSLLTTNTGTNTSTNTGWTPFNN